MYQVLQSPTETEILQLLSPESVKQNERITHNREDKLIEDLILDAYAYLDGPTGRLRRPILDSRYKYSASTLAPAFEIPFAGVKSVQSVKYWDNRVPSQLVTIDTGNYEVTVDGLYASVRFFPSFRLPTLSGERFRAVEYEFTAGFGAAQAVPRSIRRAMILLASHWYQHREATTLEQRVSTVNKKIEFGVDELIGYHIAPLRMGQS